MTRKMGFEIEVPDRVADLVEERRGEAEVVINLPGREPERYDQTSSRPSGLPQKLDS